MSEGVQKTVITLTIMHRGDYCPSGNLHDVLEDIEIGPMIGMETQRVTVDVPPGQVVSELLELGNDGTFFEDE